MTRAESDRSADVLIVLTDFPGEHYRIAAELGRALRANDVVPAFLLTSPYMERFKGERFDELGPTFYLSELLRRRRSPAPPPPDQWWMHGSFVRQEYYRGRSLVTAEDYGHIRAAVEEVIDRVDPILIWSEPPTNATLAVVHHVATDRTIEYWGVSAARVPAHFHVSRDFWAAELLESGGAGVPAEIPEGVPDYMRDAEIGQPEYAKRASVPSRVWRAVRNSRRKGQLSPETGFGPTWHAAAMLRSVERRARAAMTRLRKIPYDSDAHCLDTETSFLFPLHVRPEASTSMWARFYDNDLQTIRNLTFSLPGNANLVVKEHPAALGRRPSGFYHAVRKFPGIRLARPGLDAKTNVSRFTGLIVLTSTMGFEGLVAGVPVLVLGRIFYEDYPGATRLETWEGVSPWMRRAAAGQLSFDRHDAWLRYRDHLFPGRFDVRDKTSSGVANVRQLAAPVVRFVESQR